MKRIIGIDFGLERVGIAISDELHIAIAPQPTLLYSSNKFWPDLMKVIKNNDVGSIVVGVPYDEEEEHPMRKHIEFFIDKLYKNLLANFIDVPIHQHDESFTSIEAANLMVSVGKKKKQRSKKGIKDGVAAGLILKDYMNSNTSCISEAMPDK